MDNKRRFIFRGNAAAFGGHLIRPKDIVLEAPGASSLPVTGGRSVAKIGPQSFEDYFKIKSATTFAEGLFEDRKQFLEWTYHRVEEDSLTAVTVVSADVQGMEVGRGPRLTIGRLRSELRSKSPRGGGQPAISLGEPKKELIIEDVFFNDQRLIVELDPTPFRKYDTHAKLIAAADDPDFVKKYGNALFMLTPRTGEAPPPKAGRLIEDSCGTIYATIVKSIRWEGREPDGARIEGNKVTLPNFGRVYFGELLISSKERRLTMVRMALGSNGGGSASGSDAADNGSWGWSP